jgi:anti-anti-sigma regulatory factor
MLRITVTQWGTSSTQVKLEGRVTGASVEELRRLCEANLSGNGDASLVLDLGDVSFVGHDGIDLFRDLGRRNVEATRCSPFLTELLKEVLACS